MDPISQLKNAITQDHHRRASELDAADPISDFREQFHFPKGVNNEPLIYFCGNSLGLQPLNAEAAVIKELSDWKNLGVKGHFTGDTPWTTFHELVNEPMSRIVGAQPEEVVVMNTLTVNLHMMMVSFYRPTSERFKILIEKNAFPSDKYACQSQLEFHGYDIEEGLLQTEAREGEDNIRPEDLIELIDRQGDEIALILLGNPVIITIYVNVNLFRNLLTSHTTTGVLHMHKNLLD